MEDILKIKKTDRICPNCQSDDLMKRMGKIYFCLDCKFNGTLEEVEQLWKKLKN